MTGVRPFPSKVFVRNASLLMEKHLTTDVSAGVLNLFTL